MDPPSELGSGHRPLTNLNPSNRPPTSPILLISLYLAHLLVPLFLVWDIVVHWGLGRPTAQVSFVVFASWIVVSVGLLAASRDRRVFLDKARKPLLAIFSIYAGLALVELGSRMTVEDA